MPKNPPLVKQLQQCGEPPAHRYFPLALAGWKQMPGVRYTTRDITVKSSNLTAAISHFWEKQTAIKCTQISATHTPPADCSQEQMENSALRSSRLFRYAKGLTLPPSHGRAASALAQVDCAQQQRLSSPKKLNQTQVRGGGVGGSVQSLWQCLCQLTQTCQRAVNFHPSKQDVHNSLVFK